MSKNALFFVIIGAVVLLAVAVFFILRTLPGGEKDSKDSLEEPPSPALLQVPAATGPKTTISDEAPRESVIRYTLSGFIPQEIMVGVTGQEACVITIVNETNESLVLRLGPYDPDDAIGPQYDAVDPGESILIDPRFRIPEIAYHDRAHPERGEFSIILGAGCALE